MMSRNAWGICILIYIILTRDLIIYAVRNPSYILLNSFSLVFTFIGVFGGTFLLGKIHKETEKRNIKSHSFLYKVMNFIFHED